MDTAHKGSLRPGVVYGRDYRELISRCKSEGYALPAVNVVGTNSINAVLEAAAASASDVVIQLSHGGARFFGGEGLPTDRAAVAGAVSAARHVHEVASSYGICVVLHTDHAQRALVPWVETLIGYSEQHYQAHRRPLFSSHMLDLSEESLDSNLAECERMLQRLTPLEMGLEIELGVTGGEEDGVGSENLEEADSSHLYTRAEDVLRAYDALTPVGSFSVAAAFGNVHGVYSPGNVVLRPEILEASQKLVQQERKTVSKPMNFVFHGGSGSSQDEISRAVSYGVVKMNIDTDTQFAFAQGVGKYVNDNPSAFQAQIDEKTGKPNKKRYDPRKWLRVGEQGMVARLKTAFSDLNAVGKSLARRT